MRKGSKVENWNWQIKERKEGYHPTEQEDEAATSTDFQLHHELERVEDELQTQKEH